MSEPSTPSTGLSGSKTEDTLHPGTEPPDSLTGELRRRVLSINLAVTLLAFVLALAIGAVLIAASAPSVIESLGYFFARPFDTFAAVFNSVYSAYSALFQGALLDVNELREGVGNIHCLSSPHFGRTCRRYPIPGRAVQHRRTGADGIRCYRRRSCWFRS